MTTSINSSSSSSSDTTIEAMGLHPSLQAKVKEWMETAPPGTISHTLTVTDSSFGAVRPHKIVKIIDVLASYNGLYHWYKPKTKPSDDIPLTGSDIWEHVKKLMLLSVNNNVDKQNVRVDVIVLCADDRERVPSQKQKTQRKRRAQREKSTTRKRADPIVWDETTHDAWFVDSGLVIHDKTQTSSIQPMAVHPSQLQVSDRLRKPLFNYIRLKLESWFPTSNVCSKLYLDYDGDEVDVFEDVFHQCVPQRTILGYRVPVFGEADGKVVVWARHFNTVGCVAIETIDTDIFPWCIQLIRANEYTAPKNHVFWVTKVLDNMKVINLSKMIPHLIQRAFTLSRDPDRAFFLLTILCGTDFFEKGDLTHQFGVEDIIRAIKHSEKEWNLVRPSVELSYKYEGDFAESDIQQVMAALIRFMDGLDYHMKRAKQRLEGKPRAEDLKQIAIDVFWNMCYWSYSFRDVRMWSSNQEEEEAKDDDDVAEKDMILRSSTPDSFAPANQEAAIDWNPLPHAAEAEMEWKHEEEYALNVTQDEIEAKYVEEESIVTTPIKKRKVKKKKEKEIDPDIFEPEWSEAKAIYEAKKKARKQ